MVTCDIKTGEEIWRMSGGGDIQIPTPILGNGWIYFRTIDGIVAIGRESGRAK